MTEATGNTSTGGQDAAAGELVRQAAEQISRLVRDELALAKAEMTQKGKRAEAMPAWLAALIVAVVLFAVAGVLAVLGRREVKQATPPVPQEAVHSVKADIDEVKERAQR
jgi:hypothetical protein